MANNRMRIKCTHCGSVGPMLAKYYPNTGWYPPSDPDHDRRKDLEDWFERHGHDVYRNGDGPVHFELEFEA